MALKRMRSARPSQIMRECYLPVNRYEGEEVRVGKAAPGDKGSGAYLSTAMDGRRMSLAKPHQVIREVVLTCPQLWMGGG